MTKKIEMPPLPLGELHRNQIVRKKDGPKYFGLSNAGIDLAVKANKLPAPFSVLEGGRAMAWTGGQILDYHAERIAAVGKLPQPQNAGLAAHQKKIRKQKLHPPIKRVSAS
jgi:predicted DNA-binding transcriptional regulator AlpA